MGGNAIDYVVLRLSVCDIRLLGNCCYEDQ